jgi:predicted RND superfamily exporter protein
MKLAQALALRCARLALQHPRKVLATAGIVVVLGFWAGSRIHFDADVLNLLPQRDPLVAQFRQVLAEFGATDTLLVVVRPKSSTELELALALADALEAQLTQSPLLTRVEARLADPVLLAEAVLAHAPLFLDEKGREELAQRLTPQGLRKRAAEIRQALELPQAMVAKELVTRDLLGLLPLLLQGLPHGAAALSVDASSGYYLAADHSLLVLLAYPQRPAQDIAFDEELFADLAQRVAKAKGQVAEDWGLAEEDLPTVEVGGGHRIALEDAKLIRKDTIFNSFTSLLGVGLLLFLAFGRWRAFAVTGAPLAAGLAATFAFAGFLFPNLSQAAAGFSALLIGLGIDFSIVLYARYQEERSLGLSCHPAWETSALEVGPAIFLGALTTLATFYAFLPTHFVGLQHLGLLTGTGILFMALAALLLLPAFSALAQEKATAKAPAPWLRLEGALTWAQRHRAWVLSASALLSGISLFLAFSLPFDDDVRHLRSAANQGVQIQEEVAKAFGQSFNAMGVRLQAGDELALLQQAQAFVEALRPLQRAGILTHVDSLASLVPPLGQQQKALSWLAAQKLDPEAVVATFRQALADQGLVPDAFAPGLELVRRMLSPQGLVTYQMWQGTALEPVIRRSMYQGHGYVSTLVSIYTPAGTWRRQAPPQLVQLVQQTPGASLVGVNVLAEHLRQVVRRDALLATALGLVVVWVLLVLQLRRGTHALLCLLPVAFGLLLAGGTAAALKLPLTPLNVFVAVMVIGIASDYGIHLVHRLRENPQGLAGTARALALAALTTMVGFGSLVTSHYPGLASIGWMTVFGVFWSVLAALLLLPVLWRKP